MRIAVFSDVHGNLTALNAVLAHIAAKQVDQIVFAGDLCFAGPRPADCLQTLREAQAIPIFGNTDEWIIGRHEPPEHIKSMAKWTSERLSNSQKDWLNTLPFSLRISPKPNRRADLIIVHANPVDVNQVIFPSETEQLERYGRIRQTDSDLSPLIEGQEGAILAYGHLHIPNERIYNPLKLINISSVSMPGDNDPRAKYGLFNWTGMDWQFELCRVSYSIEPEIDAYRLERPPGWENIIQTIINEGCYPQKV